MLKHGILGLLNYRPMTGYEINVVFRDSLSYFWSAQTSQIYRELQTLKRSGWVADELIEQKERPDKKLFSITDDGRAELRRWLRDGGVPIGPNSPLLMKTFFLGELTDSESTAFFTELEHDSGGNRKYLEAARQAIDEYASMLPAGKKALYWRMTLDYGMMYAEMTEKWAAHCAEMIREGEK